MKRKCFNATEPSPCRERYIIDQNSQSKKKKKTTMKNKYRASYKHVHVKRNLHHATHIKKNKQSIKTNTIRQKYNYIYQQFNRSIGPNGIWQTYPSHQNNKHSCILTTYSPSAIIPVFLNKLIISTTKTTKRKSNTNVIRRQSVGWNWPTNKTNITKN